MVVDFLPPVVLEIMSKFDDAGVSKAREELAALNAMKATVTAKVTVDGRDELAALKAQLAGLRDKSVKVKLTPETGTSTGSGSRAATEYADEFDRTLRTRLTAAMKAMPALQIGAATTEAEQRIRDLVIRIRTLRDARIGVDISDTEARAKIGALLVELRTLAAQSPDVRIRVDAGRAAAEVAALEAQLRTVNNPSILQGLSGAVSETASGMGGLGGAVAGVAAGLPLIAPLAATAAAGLVALGAAASVAMAGLGVLALGSMGVIKAVQAMGEAHKAAGGSTKSGTNQAFQMASALDSVRSAERGLSGALRDAQHAQDEMTSARREAQRAIEDLNISLRQGQLDEQQGALNVRRALLELRKVRSDASSTRLDREQAQLSYEQAVAAVDSLHVHQARLATDTADANAKGVEGSDQVRAAQERVLDTQDRVLAATQALAAAHRQVEQAAVSAGTAGGAAMNSLADAMAALSPQGREFAQFLYDLIHGPIAELRRTAEAGLLPGIEDGLKSLLPYLPQINAFVGNMAKALGDVAGEALKSLGSPQWKEFFSYMAEIGPPALKAMAEILGNVARGFASLIVAFAPTTKDIGEGLLHMSESFANWAGKLAKSPEFKEFIAYIKENGPKLLDIAKNVGEAFINFMKSMSGNGSNILDLVDSLSRLMKTMSEHPAMMKMMAGMLDLLVQGITKAIDAVNSMVNGLSGAGHTFESLKATVLPVWDAIKTGALFLWDNVLKPVFEGIKAIIENVVAPVFNWLWHNLLVPFWEAVSVIFKVGWAVIQMVFGLIEMAIKTVVAPIFHWLYDHVIKPVWQNMIRPVFHALADIWKDKIQPAFRAGVDIIGRIWDDLVGIVKKPLKIVVNFINEGVIDNYNKLASKFGGPHVDRISLPKGFARGGVIPGTDRGVDSVLAMMRPGEGVLVPEAVRAIGGPAALGALNAAASGGGTAMFGPVGNGAPPATIVETHVHVWLDGQELVSGLTRTAQQTKFRSGMSGLA